MGTTKYLIGICILLFSLVASADGKDGVTFITTTQEVNGIKDCKIIQIAGGAGYGLYALATCIIRCPYNTNAKCVTNKVFKIK